MKLRRHGLFRITAAALTLTFLFVASIPAESMAYVVGSGAFDGYGGPASDRDADMDKIQRALESKIVSKRLMALGLSEEEIDSRLSRLSDEEVHTFAVQVDSLYPGGDVLSIVVGALLIVLLVILILKVMDKSIVIK